MASGLVGDVDRLGAEELGSMLALAEALRLAIERRGAVSPKGAPRRVVELRIRVSAVTMDRYGHLMPGSEAEAASRLGEYLPGARSAAMAAAT